MPVLIDGNNLLYAANDAEPEHPPSRSAVCRMLGDWVRAGFERKVHVVFDGAGPDGERARQIGDSDIQVTYSGRGVSADEVILRLLRQDPAPRRLRVVSTDHVIAKAARARRASSVRSDDFWRRLRREWREARRPEAPAAPEKPDSVSPSELEEWLRAFSQPKRPTP